MGRLVAFDFDQLTVGAAERGLTEAKVRLADEVEVEVERGLIRLRLDGTDATAATGPLRGPGFRRVLTKHEAVQLSMIRAQDATEDGLVQATYYRLA